MKNILFLHSSSELYGSDKSLFNIVNSIDKSKYNVHVILPCDGPLVNKISKIPNVKLSVYNIAILRRKNLSIKGLLKYFKDLKKSVKYLKNYISKYKIDLIETNTCVVFPGAIAAKKTKVKSVWHIREIISNKIENIVISFLMNRYSDIIVANSKSTAKSIHVNNKKVRVVYNSIELGSLEKKIDYSPIIGMAGRINRWKGQKLFIDAAILVLKKIPEAQFFIAGDSYYGEEYMKNELLYIIKSNKLEKSIHLLGQVNNMEEFYNKINLFVLPSIKPEPFGLVVVEAMSHGIPVIATNHGGPVEIIKNNETGILVDYNEAREMADSIIKLLENKNDYDRISNNSIIEVQEKYSIDAMINNLEDIYDELFNEKM